MVILMAIGILCYKLQLVDEETNRKLSSLVLLLVNPIVIFMSYLRPFEASLLNGMVIALVLATISFAIGITVTHFAYRARAGKDSAVEKFAGVYSNCGFIGIPLINGVVGSEGVFYLTAYLTLFNLLVWTHGVTIMSGNRNIAFIKKALISPPIIAVFLGFTFFLLGISVPDVIKYPMQLLSDMNTPLAMIVAGISISKTNILKILKDIRIYKLCFIRLILIPILFVGIVNLFDIPVLITITIIIATGCPTAANIILFAHRYNKDYLYGAELFATTTIISMGTIPLLLMLV